MVVDEARELVDPWRRLYAPDVIGRGLPPHITVLYPFAPAGHLDGRMLDELREHFAAVEALDFDLVRMEEFPGSVWLAPEPSAALASLCAATWARYPELPPYGGSILDRPLT